MSVKKDQINVAFNTQKIYFFYTFLKLVPFFKPLNNLFFLEIQVSHFVEDKVFVNVENVNVMPQM